MFTGLIEEKGVIDAVQPASYGRRFCIAAERVMEDLKTEDSIAVNGVCMTVTGFERHLFKCDAVRETLECSTLSSLKKGDRINLERARRMGDRLGGHLMQGHVDAVGVVRRIDKWTDQWDLLIDCPADLLKYTIVKGSIAIDGMSLTIAGISGHTLKIAIIPYTLKATVVPGYRPGTEVNIEVDMIGKYIESIIGTQDSSKDESYYRSHGF
jgi:riboflavin synthase